MAKYLANESYLPKYDENLNPLPMGITLYAKWKSENPLLIINADGGYFPEADGSKKESIEIKLTNFADTYTTVETFNDYLIKNIVPLKDKAVKEHYKVINFIYYTNIFDENWKTDQYNGLYHDLLAGQDCEIKVVWTDKKEVVFETNGGSTIKTYEFKDGKSLELFKLYSKDFIPEKDGYIFAGWYRDKELNKLLDYSIGGIESVTLYADWVEKDHEVTSSNAGVTFSNIASKMKFLNIGITEKDEQNINLPIDEELMDLWTVNVKYTGNIGNEDIKKISSAMQKTFYYTSTGTVYCNLDLSEATGLTDLPDEGFIDCEGLRSIKISQKISNIGTSGSYNGSGCFQGCTNLKSVTLPASLTTIGNGSFKGCTSLTSIVIPDGVTAIGKSVFINCSKLKKVTIPVSVQTIGSAAFMNCVELEEIALPSYVYVISSELFNGCTMLKKISFSNSVYEIEQGAFMGCTSLSSFSIPNDVEIININTFKDCTSLLSVTIPKGVTSIEDSAFENCEMLKNVELPITLVTIGNETFKNCKAFTSIAIPSEVTSIGSSAFNNCVNLTTINVPSKVTELSYHIFDGCISLSDVTLSEGLLTIGERAFVDCRKLTALSIPSTVTGIRTCAFYNCSGLTSITIPGAVTRIADSVFVGCTAITEIKFNESSNWYNVDADVISGGTTDISLSDPVENVKIFIRKYSKKFWYKK